MASSRNRCVEIRNPQEKRLIKPNNLASTSCHEICDDNLTEILCRLPGKTLVRFKCVSKHWLNLINSPEFIQQLLPKKEDPDFLLGLFYQYTSNRKTQIRFAEVEASTQLQDNNEECVNTRVLKDLNCLDFWVSFLPCDRSLSILGCHRGLILCSTPRRSGIYYVCNPITKQYVSLPRPEVSSLRFLMLGLYVEKESGHFQVVLIPCINDVKSVAAQIFSSVTGTWKSSASSKDFEVPWDSSRNICYSYGSHVVQAAGRSLYWLLKCWRAVVYDIDTETIRVINIPQYGIEFFGHTCATLGRLGEIDGGLRFLYIGDQDTLIWELKEHMWTCMWMVDTYDIVSTLRPEINRRDWMRKPFLKLKPIGFHSSDPDVVVFMLELNIFSYSFETGEGEWLMDYDLEPQVNYEKLFLYILPKVPFPFQERKKRKRKEKVTLPKL